MKRRATDVVGMRAYDPMRKKLLSGNNCDLNAVAGPRRRFEHDADTRHENARLCDRLDYRQQLLVDRSLRIHHTDDIVHPAFNNGVAP